MNYRLLGRTGLYVSEMCLGTMTYGGNEGIWGFIGNLGQKEVDRQIGLAWDMGVNFFDTANIYSYGDSEKLFGKAIKNNKIPRYKTIIATKVRGRIEDGPNEAGLSRKHILHQLDESLKRLGTDYIDLYQIHGPDPVTPMEETLRTLEDTIRSGKVRYIGISNHMAWQTMEALSISEKHGWNRFESIQAYYSIAGRELEREIIPLAKKQNLGIMVWSPLAGGFLTGKFSRDVKGPKGARRTDFDFPPVNKDLAFNCIDKMKIIAEKHNISIAQTALAWVLHQPGISTVIMGAKKENQLKENLEVSNIKLTEEDLNVLNEVSRIAPEYPGWMLPNWYKNREPDAKAIELHRLEKPVSE